MKLTKSFLKGSLLLSSVLLLSACGNNEVKEETTVAETTVAETTVIDTTEADESEESKDESEESTDESEESTDESEESKDESEESTDESEESTDESEESTDESEESKDESEESKDESEESKDESEESKDESEESTDESEESTDESEESKDESEESTDESEESTDESEESKDESEESKDQSEDAVVAVPSTDETELKDGEYTAVSNEDEHGWSIKHVIVVKDGKISESRFDYVNAEGALKSEDKEYNKKMKEIAGVAGADAMKELNAALVEKQMPEVDVVTGATNTSNQFILSSNVLIKAAQEGKTEEINIDELPLQDGNFSVQGEVDEHGWSPMMSMVVKEGKISEVTFDYTNAEGALKSEDKEYNKKMKEVAGIAGADAMKQLSESLIKTQNIADVDLVSGATSTSETFVKLAEQLIQMSQMQVSNNEEDKETEETVESQESSEASESESTEKAETTEKKS